LGKPTKRKRSARRARTPDAESFDVYVMDSDELIRVAINFLIEEALESGDVEKWKRAMALYCANQGKDPPMFQTNGAARGKAAIRERAQRMYQIVGDFLTECGCQRSDVFVAAGLLRLFTATRYLLDCHPEAPTWRDVDSLDFDSAFPLAVTAIALEIAPIRRGHESPDPARIVRAAARALGMDERRVNNLVPGV
jgi:hypothetical protein